MSMDVCGLQPISKFLGERDSESSRTWLTRVAKSLPDTHFTERTVMQNQHREMPGSGVMYWEDEEMRKSPKGPDFKGFLVLEMDYKAGEKLKIAAWEKPTSRGTNLLALKEDNWSKKKRQEEMADKEVPSRYANTRGTFRKKNDDSDIPF